MNDKEKTSLIIEVDINSSRLEAIFNKIIPLFPDVSVSDLTKTLVLGFELDGTTTMWTNGTPRAVFKPLNFLLELLPTVRAGKLSFSAFESILKAKRRIWNKSNHN